MQRVQKPIRLYVLTIFIVLGYGIMPFISTMPFARGFLLLGIWNLPLNGSIYVLYGAEGETSLPVVIISLALCVFTAASAIWAFYGDKEGRMAALVFVTLDVVWWTILVVLVIASNQLRIADTLVLMIEPIPPILWLTFIWWNFTRPDMNAYYAYQSSLQR